MVLSIAAVVNGDLMQSIDGQPTPSVNALDSIIARRQLGDVFVTDESAGLPLTDEIRAFRASWLGSNERSERTLQ